MSVFSRTFAGRVRGWRALAGVFVASLLAVSCGGASNNTIPSSTGTGTGTVPHYQSGVEVLNLPLVQVAGNMLTDVKLQFKKDGSWTLLSAGPERVASVADKPTAVLGAPGNEAGFKGAQTNTTLTIGRLHVGSRVLGGLEFRLTGSRWAFVSDPKEVKTLHAEDFKSNPRLRADESHHVILKSDAASGVQNVPMQLAARSYKFCMDAQAEGADSTTLLDAAGNTVFTLKAGEPCVTITGKQAAYTLQHRYGGNGSARTVFMRSQANTTTATIAAARAPAPAQRLLGAVAAPRASLLANLTSDANGVTKYPGTEYWSIGRPGDDGLSFLGVVGRPSNNYGSIGPSLCADPLNFGFHDLWLSNTFLLVGKDLSGTPDYLGLPLACTSDPVANQMGIETSYITAINDANYVTLHTAFKSDQYSGWGSSPDGRSFPDYLNAAADWAVQTLSISNQIGDQFELLANNQRVTQVPPYYDSFGENFQLAMYETSDDPVQYPSVPLIVQYRYFPDGLPTSVTLGVGQLALFTGLNCSGAAIITTQSQLPYLTSTDASATNAFGSVPLYQPTSLPGLNTLGTSFQLGLQTSATAYTGQYFTGEQQQFSQLTCNSGGLLSSGTSPASIKTAVDTITMVISTNSCEYCNLAGADFSGQTMIGVKLGHANLSGALLSNVNLSNADLRSVTLQAAQMLYANLEGANLCLAQLNGSVAVAKAATLTGAHLKNTNLAGAILDGVKFSSASFYSSGGQGACQPDRCGDLPSTCAGAYGASINNASFDSAYLSNTDMGKVTGVAVNFTNAALLGVSFVGADLSHNNTSTVSSFFNNAYLQGSDFTNAVLKFADFTGAQFDQTTSCIQANLSPSYGRFAGSTVPTGSGSTASCEPGQPSAPFCVVSKFAASTAYPVTDCTNTCPDATPGGVVGPQKGTCSGVATCSADSWANPWGGGGNAAMPTSKVCTGTAQLCGDPFGRKQCW